jgi:endonuclease YncB( thermonuclease family)
MFSFAKQAAFFGMLFFALVCFWPALKKDHSGFASIIDAGIIELNGERHCLYGLHAVEPAKICRHRDGSQWPCGREAAEALAKFLKGKKVVCEPHGRDGDGQYSSICYAGGDNINAWLVGEGWAMADRDAPRLLNFASEESMARFLGKGVWSGEFNKHRHEKE